QLVPWHAVPSSDSRFHRSLACLSGLSALLISMAGKQREVDSIGLMRFQCSALPKFVVSSSKCWGMGTGEVLWSACSVPFQLAAPKAAKPSFSPLNCNADVPLTARLCLLSFFCNATA
ncbi:unnamed protein product, partial [Phaeothamnion confervicola]